MLPVKLVVSASGGCVVDSMFTTAPVVYERLCFVLTGNVWPEMLI